MKILYIIDTLGPGGKERRLTELLKGLRFISEIESELVVMSNDIHYTEILNIGIKIHHLLRKTRKDLSVFWKLFRLLRTGKPDVVHCWDSMTAVYVAPLCRILQIKFVNGMVIDSPLRRNIFNKHWLRARLTFPLSDLIVGNSMSGLSAYNAGSKGVVVYNGFNFERIQTLIDKSTIRYQLNIDTDFVIGMVGTFWAQKDYATFYKAAGLILERRRDVTFLAIGAGTDSPDSIDLIDHKFSGNFRLLGKRTGIESYVNAMDICILSTFTEGISNSILEYMALAKPVIASKGGGTSELMQDNVTGFLVPSSDPEKLAEKIDVLLNDQLLCKKMGSAGRERILNEFSIDKMVIKYADAYKRVCKNN